MEMEESEKANEQYGVVNCVMNDVNGSFEEWMLNMNIFKFCILILEFIFKSNQLEIGHANHNNQKIKHTFSMTISNSVIL
jgi:hypothetical protein